MKVSREQAALNRQRVVEVASKLFREKGYDGIGVADLMKSAGLTHGGFYGQFASKESLMTEASTLALQNSIANWRTKGTLPEIVDSYLSARHRDQPDSGCPAAAMGGDIARTLPGAQQAFAAATRQQFALLAGLMPDGDSTLQHQQAITTFAAMVGAMVLARAVGDDPLSDDILGAVRAELLGS
ncbi:TetR/AcrR family transcriptional regulator [Janthinobacterium aquaticum]|uniref:TetR/AcrR family transcriptional regulator n=1 Tax=Janthinobacterium sp. FT58W TaxID=2654254 RepID=UPI0012647133|nr:TetR/AcrR family transcriptional regulator [Janthinobacterium sp. FT58W]KAB8045107.1 TetR family transcriptional regulator [Janthinobacterium sp. FT58W]